MTPSQVFTELEVTNGDKLASDIDELDSGAAPWKSQSVANVGIGSKCSIYHMPKEEMLEHEIPSEVAYRMIQDDLRFDGDPTLNLGSFVTTCMEHEAEKLMVDALSKNFINHESYPVTTDIQNRCVSIIAHLFNAPKTGNFVEAVGTSTIGSSEAILLATLAMKKRWTARQKAAGKDCSTPNLIMSSAVQVCWKKAAIYFDIEERYVHCTQGRYTIDPCEALELVDENTIGICSILGTTYTGEYEDTKAINDLLVERNLDVPIHVDAASGGFVAPFLNPNLIWDFRLEKVTSINVSGHKYGFVYAGVGWVIWRGANYLPKELVFNHNYLGAEQASVTLNFSRGASHIICQYYKLIRLGKSGYRRIMLDLLRTAEYLASNLEKMGCFVLMSRKYGQGLPLVAFRLDSAKGYPFDEFAIADELHRQGGWMVPAYTMVLRSGEIKMLRVVVREDFSPSLCDVFISDVNKALQRLETAGAHTSKGTSIIQNGASG